MFVNNIYQVSADPKIYLGIGSKHWNELKGTKTEKAYLITHPMWYFSLNSARMLWKLKLMLKKQHVELIILHNTPFELTISRLTGLMGYFVNQNIHVCEHNFHAVPGAKKIYDAIYIAAAKKYKRMHLASKIKNLYIVTYFWPDVRNEKGKWDLHAFEPAVRHASFNDDRIDKAEINKLLNLSHCGLALSRKEGAMLASMEYQLSGLPVVTTPSIGGRDILLDPAHTIWVKPDADKIAAAVNTFVTSPPDPVEVRRRTLENLDFHRKRFYEVVKGIYQKNNKTIESYEVFRNKIWGSKNGLEAINIME